MQHSRMLLSMKYIVPLLTNKICLQCGNIKLWEYAPVVCKFEWPVARTIHSTTNANASFTEKAPSAPISTIRRWLEKIKFIDIEASRAYTISTMAYEHIADKIDYSVFYKDFNMADTFYSWFLVTELHVWMLMVRYMAEGKYGKIARNSLVEAMWTDVNTRSKLIGRISASIRKKQIMDLSYQFNAAVIAYDEGLMSDDKVLAGALWGRFFNLECNNPEAIERLIIYVRKQMDLLDRIPSQKIFRNPEIHWIELKDININ
ncbi:hypothetical protein KPH14_005945 [Odynerus spinipes]|uniref:Ubiquinol-cytochrome c chaperone domain-containing protein n=1 Tax=Odynerus spinipes TaxID=1348599 RepID=A0AAD9RJP5_9HYME|nr:hypothetical protein KPH14_005945 [Odynerus spinipes]